MQTTDFCRDWKFAKGNIERAFESDLDDASWGDVILPQSGGPSRFRSYNTGRVITIPRDRLDIAQFASCIASTDQT